MALEEKDGNIHFAADSPQRKNLRPDTPKRATPLRLLPWKNGKSVATANKFGTPSYPSPLDRIRTGRRERAKQLGLETPTKYADFETNQSFPGTARPPSRSERSPEIMGDFKRCSLATLTADTQKSVSFAAGSSKGSFGYNPNLSRRSRPPSSNWIYYGFVGGGQSGVTFPTGIQNPNKAIITVDAKTNEILVANKMACRLLSIKGSELYGKCLCDFLEGGKKWYAMQDTQLSSGGEMVTIAGKVMELVTKDGEIVPVSVWLHRLTTNKDEERHVVVMEPVSRTIATAIFDKQGTILCADEKLVTLHGYQSTNSLEGMSIAQLLPFLNLPSSTSANGSALPKEIKKQNTTARTCDGITFPVTVRIEMVKDTDSASENKGCQSSLYKAVLWVFSNISGLVTVFPDGSIHSCNNNFSLALFGYSQSQLIDKNITTLIPSFYDDLEFLDTESILLPPLDDDDDEEDVKFLHPKLCRNDSCHSHGTPRPMNPIGKQIELMIEDVSQAVHGLALDSPSQFVQFLRNSSASEPPTRSPSADCFLGNNPIMLPSGSCHAQLNCATCERGLLAGCFGYDSFARTPQQDSKSLNGLASTNRTRAKESEREKFRLPIVKSEPGQEKSFDVFSELGATRTDSDCGTAADPVTMDRLSRDTMSSTPNEVHERPPKFVMNRYGSLESLQSIPEGNYFGLGRHKNGSDLAIIYQIKRVELDDGHVLYCLWISRDPEELAEGGRPCCSLTFQSSVFSCATSRYNASKTSSMLDHEQSRTHHEEEIVDTSDDDLSCLDEEFELGEYTGHYTNLQQIGKGGFGFVKMAYRNSDKLLVVTKFIKKYYIEQENFVFDAVLNKKVALEISLLLTLKHPNIVQVIDVFESKIAFQLVLEKHGSGMDLFEFIDRAPVLDEPLTSYMFRQIVSAIAYLHRLNIVHRDIKDENIILDQNFHIKLIDFGAATFMAPDRYFRWFCGTEDYCSPEVLLGNNYRGPELEMWAVGMTLYVLVFRKNAFFSLEETILGVLNPPFDVSQSLMDLLSHMLDPDPSTRYTVSQAAEHPWTNLPVSIEKYRFEDVVYANEEEVNPKAYYNVERSKESPTKSPRQYDANTGSVKSRKSTSLSNTSDECYEEQDSFS